LNTKNERNVILGEKFKNMPKKHQKTGKSYHGSYMYSKIIWNETERSVYELLW